MINIPTVSLKFCEFNKNKQSLKMASEFIGMPSCFDLVSHHTGEVVRFNVVKPDDVLFCPDQWDGEQKIYRPSKPLKNVQSMTIYNQY